MKTADIRRRFLDFFSARDHVVVPSASLVYNDPTLLFVNAGMVPFKSYFTGAEEAPFRRAVSVQKCVRTLDIDEVGKTTRHGTFFQMLGNFSFGDYFKQEAIRYAWDLVTSSQASGGFGFDPDKIWTTVLHSDDEAFEIWRGMGIPPERIQRRGLKDNYWHMGVPGPGGPCSEIYIDRGPEFGPDGGPEADEDRFLEIWNLVFQTEELSEVRSKADFDVARELPSKNIDTGAGLERIAYLLQGVSNMYEIDEVYPVIQRAAELAGTRYGADAEADIRLRVVGDHIRSSLMLMTDGVAPGNEARGYVLRRLLRRSIRSMRLLGVDDRVLPDLLPVSKALMEQSYPEITEQWDRVSQVAYAEEDTFRHTLAAGTRIFDVAVADAKAANQTVLSGDRAFQLHDTYGFPIDLTLEMASEAGLQVDEAEFRRLMQEQRDRAKADSRAKKGGAVAQDAYRQLRHAGETGFVGYTGLTHDSTVRGIIVDGSIANSAQAGDVVEIVLEDTPFYAESGGQAADSGVITGDGVSMQVLDVQKPIQGLIVHKVRVTEGELVTGADVRAEVNREARLGSAQAHTATHIVHAVLRQLLGPTAVQAGSYNKPGYLRFDFSSQVSLSADLRAELEARSNAAIRADYQVKFHQMSLEQAKDFGAMAMFGEKYGKVVRVVQIDDDFSRELCGGVHVEHSSRIQLVTLLGESSIGSGIRRVEALVGTDAFEHLAAERALVQNLAASLKVQPDQLTDQVEKLVTQLKQAQREIAELKSQHLLGQAGMLINQAEKVGPIDLVAAELPGVGGGELRTLAINLRDRMGARPGVVALIGGTKDKPVVVVATTGTARTAGARAGALVGIAASALGGRGGGKDDLAQGGGSSSEQAPAALAGVRAAVATLRAA